jgi:hypothetical protein
VDEETALSRKAANVRALQSGSLVVRRAAITNVLPVPHADVLRRPFKCPVKGSTATGPSGARRGRRERRCSSLAHTAH